MVTLIIAMITIPQQTRPEQITEQYIRLIDEHLHNLISGKAIDMLEIEDFAGLLFIHPTHLSNTIKEQLGTSPCGVYQTKILETAQQLLSVTNKPIRQIALLLTYEPSQFTKWFKRFTGLTPKQFRQQK